MIGPLHTADRQIGKQSLGAAILPAPLTQRNTFSDLGEWFVGAEAEAERARLLERRRLAAAAEIRGADLATLPEQPRQIRELQIRQAAAATRLRVALDQDRRIEIGSESLEGSGERLLLAAGAVRRRDAASGPALRLPSGELAGAGRRRQIAGSAARRGTNPRRLRHD
ncbi:hypothetical protein [Accumulibacter sp.]|uniref:hypothetical protein n=1 Tax=Accumulibacter sp. TaxID=2053492 RepID=UPI00261E5786|nr:hypothetical protein [Accumulibacter sp.]